VTPRQIAAAERQLKKLYVMKARAEKPVHKRIDSMGSKEAKAVAALRKKFARATGPLFKKLEAIDKRFEKRINAVARKIH
jgi:hypothetical protein